MAKKQQSYFGPSLGDTFLQTPAANSLTRHANREPPSPRHKALFDESDMQNLTIDAQSVKTALGMSKIAELHQHGTSLFGDTLSTILEVKEQVYNKEAQPIVEEFTTRQISMYGRQTLAAMEVGGTAIGYEINRSLYVAPMQEPERKKGFWQRLIG